MYENNSQQIKEVLANEMKLSAELVDFIKQCLHRIYWDKADISIAIEELNKYLTFGDQWSCLSLSVIEDIIKDCKERRESYKKKQEKIETQEEKSTV